MAAGLFDRAVASSLPLMPRALVRRVAARYVAGETLAEAIEEAGRLVAEGCRTTHDLLGEAIHGEAEAEQVVQSYLGILDALAARGLEGNISVKPTAVGLGTSPALLERNAARLAARAAELGSFVRIDMEDSATTSDTLAVFRRLREAGHGNVGIVLQAMLRRTPADLSALGDLAPSVRLCKGVYVEPPERAWQRREEVVSAFLALLEELLTRPDHRVGIATHDDPVIEGAERILRRLRVPPERYEFQMLLGVRPELRARLLAHGHRVRVYVPHGAAWHAYCVRRLRENPKFAGFVTKDVLRNPKMLLGDRSGR